MSTTTQIPQSTQIPAETALKYAEIVQEFRDGLSPQKSGVLEANELMLAYIDNWGDVEAAKVYFFVNLTSFLYKLEQIPDPE